MSTETPPAGKLSPVEGFKEQSRQLRGTIAAELADPAVDHLSEANKQLLKFHGSYQQEDRDARKNRSKEGVGKHYMFMIRAKIPGGKLTAEQYLALDELAGRYANGTIRLTTRQSIQFHGILKDSLKPTIAAMNDALVTTLGGCGDVNRNVMACPAPYADEIHPTMQRLADAIASHLAPRSLAYHDIWLNGARQTTDSEQIVDEPIYGKVYLPRKFKIGIALPDDNCIDIHAQDLGFLGVLEQGRLVGFDVLVGGGMGLTNSRADTFAHLGQAVCFVPVDRVVAAAEAVVKLYRDHGNRADRKRARIKYLVADWGVEKFRAMLAEYLGPLTMPRDVRVTGIDLHLGWNDQGDGKHFVGISVENGRIKDDGSVRLRSALREIVGQFRPSVRLTGQQDILLCDLPESARPAIDAILRDHGVRGPAELSFARKFGMSCPAIPTCGLAISESERALPGVIDELETVLAELGLADQPLSVRMTGCPNGCARPYNSDVGIVGRSGDKYTLYVGGNTISDRLIFELVDLVPRGQLVTKLRPLLARYQTDRTAGESFGTWCNRQGVEALRALLG